MLRPERRFKVKLNCHRCDVSECNIRFNSDSPIFKQKCSPIDIQRSVVSVFVCVCVCIYKCGWVGACVNCRIYSELVSP